MKKASSTGRKNATTRGRKASSAKTPKGAASPAAKTFGGKRYTKKACSATKTGAKATAKKLREAGKNARVVKGGPGKYCVYARG